MINYNHEFKTPLFWVNQGYLTSHMTFKSSKKKKQNFETRIPHKRFQSNF
jgi:hypothetical protein